jgi:hypothetical protein
MVYVLSLLILTGCLVSAVKCGLFQFLFFSGVTLIMVFLHVCCPVCVVCCTVSSRFFSAALAYVVVCVFLVINLKQLLIADVAEKEFCM